MSPNIKSTSTLNSSQPTPQNLSNQPNQSDNFEIYDKLDNAVTSDLSEQSEINSPDERQNYTRIAVVELSREVIVEEASAFPPIEYLERIEIHCTWKY